MSRLFSIILGLLCGLSAFDEDSARLLSIDHYVRVRSTVPAIAGQNRGRSMYAKLSGWYSRSRSRGG